MVRLGIVLLIVVFLQSSCAVIRPGEVGVKQRIGKLSNKVFDQGAYFFNPFTTRMIKTPVRTVNMELTLSLPSKEGLNINSNISILYRIDSEKVPMLIEQVGDNYENIISSVFRSASADICAQYMAKDMHSGKRGSIEAEISKVMNNQLNSRGIEIEAVLLKSITLPEGLYNSIETRLEAEQEVMRMQFLIEQEKLEAQRRVIAAEGQRDAQKILSEGLTEEILKLRSIEALEKLSQSANSKIIISPSATPFIIQSNDNP